MRYIRKRDSGIEEAPASPFRGKSWYLANGYLAYSGTLALSRLSIADGAVVELEETESAATEEWVDKETFINALASLLDSDTLAKELSVPNTFKTGLKGLALLTTNAAPDGQINLLDARVEPWLETFGLTRELVRQEIQTLEDVVESDSGSGESDGADV